MGAPDLLQDLSLPYYELTHLHPTILFKLIPTSDATPGKAFFVCDISCVSGNIN